MSVDDRPLWLCHYGTVEFCVRARTAEVAEAKVRTDQLGDRVTLRDLEHAPVRRHGPMNVRVATDHDLERRHDIKSAQQKVAAR